MDKIKIGIPRGLFYYYHGQFLKDFFEYLDFQVIVSPKNNPEIVSKGIEFSSDEMCLSLKNFLGHVSYLSDKCDYLLMMRIVNYGTFDQTCTNFCAIYDLVNNLFDIDILNINIDVNNQETLKLGLMKICKYFKKDFNTAYDYALNKEINRKKQLEKENILKLKNKNKKVLIVGHPYNVYDELVGKPIIKFLEKEDVTVIYSDRFDSDITNSLSKKISKNLFWKYSKENIGAVSLTENMIDGVIFISSFPCGPDSLVNELVMRKISKPYLNIIVDDINSNAGLETRLESFIDILV